MDLNLVRLVFTLKLETDCADPYVLFGLKPFFTDAFRLAAGCKQPGCEKCFQGGDCSFHLMFAQFLTDDPAALKRYQKPSYPFVFDIPEIPPLPNAGLTVELGLNLAGMAVNHIEKFVAAVQGMLIITGLQKRIRLSLVRIESEGYDGSRIPIMATGEEVETGQVVTLSLRGLQETVIIPGDAVTVTFVSPLRIMREGRPIMDFSFPAFIRALMRRLSSLVYYYGTEEAELDFKWLSSQSLTVKAVAVDFKWVERGSKSSGLIGSGTFSGVLPDYHTFLLAGEYLHVGKRASFGMGAFHVNKTA